MVTKTLPMVAFNRGLVSRLGLSRQDVKRIALSAQTMTNWLPRVLGSMSLRPGLGLIGAVKSNAATKMIEFTFSSSDKALLELTANVMRVWIADAVLTRVAVSTAIANGNFTANLTSWTDADEGGAVSQWTAPGYMELLGTGTNAAIRTQTVTVAGGDQNKEHALRIKIARGPVTIRVGSTVGGEEYVAERNLETGEHSLAFTPTGDFYLRFQSRLNRVVWVDSCNVEAAGVVEIPTPWPAAALGLLRYDESADVIFVACTGYQQRRIERGSTRSWSVVLYKSDDGPFRVMNTGPGTLAPSVITGNGTLTSSIPLFRNTHVGALFAVTSTGQTVVKSMALLNDVTDSIRVTGILTDRAFTIVLTGLSATGNTVILQRSFDNTVWSAVATKSWVADTTESYTDGLDNQIVYYRLKCSVYAAGTTVAGLIIATGSIRGAARITAFTSSTVVDMEVVRAFGGNAATADWEEGQWSDYRGWPSAVTFAEGRLWFGGKDSIVGSVSDAFNSFDPEVIGDSGVINRQLGGAQVDTVNWILPLQRLMAGGQGAEHSCRSSALGEPLTPTNFNPKRSSTQGSAPVRAVAIDNQGVFVQRGGTRVFNLSLSGNTVMYDYEASNLCSTIPEIGKPSIVRIAVQRQPDTRVHCVRSDGTAALLVYDPNEQVTCWVEIETDGLIEDVVVLPGDSGDDEDHVYYVVNRTISGAVTRNIERWAFASECIKDVTLCKLADSFVTYSGAPATVISGLSHLEGKQVVVWADGDDVGYDDSEALIYTVASGQITLAVAASNVVVGLPYTADFQSGKLLELAFQGETPLNNIRAIRSMGIIMADIHSRGIQYGPDFTHLFDMPRVERGETLDPNEVFEEYDENPFPFPGSWSTDERLCLRAKAPRPATVLSAVLEVET